MGRDQEAEEGGGFCLGSLSVPSPQTAKRHREGEDAEEMASEDGPTLGHRAPQPSSQLRRPPRLDSVTQPHPQRRAPRGANRWVLHELYCGIGSMSWCLSEQGFEVLLGCDSDADALSVFAEKHPGATLHSDAVTLLEQARRDPLQGKQRESSLLVVGGPPCTALSLAGKQQYHRDGSSQHILVLAEYAVAVGADVLILENVPSLLDVDAKQLRDGLLQTAGQGDLALRDVWRLRDADLGGHTQRERVFFFFAKREPTSLTGNLPRLAQPAKPMRRRDCGWRANSKK